MKLLKDRLAYALSLKPDLSQADLARATGAKGPSVSAWFSGNTKTLKGHNLLATAAALDVRPEWLSTGAPPMHAVHGVGEEPAIYAVDEPRAGYFRLQLLDGEVSSGPGMQNSDHPDVVQWIDVAEWWARKNLAVPFARVRIITNRGDSNAPDILDGDLIFVDIGVQHFESPGLYVLNWNGLAIVKRLAPEFSTGKLAIISKNPAYPTEYVAAGELGTLHICARVLAWWTLKKF